MKILHIITGLGQGGAEGALFRLVKATPETDHMVISLSGEGYWGPRLRTLGVQVVTCKGFRRLYRVYHLIRAEKPDVMQTWMYHADFLGGLASRILGIPVIWGIRNSTLDRVKSSLSTRVIVKICAFLSDYIPEAIVCCSHNAAIIHGRIGYQTKKFEIISNGYDLNDFHPDTNARRYIRKLWDLEDEEFVIGTVARWDPQKDHPTLLRGLRAVCNMGIPFMCVLVGTGMTDQNAELVSLISSLGLSRHILLVGPRSDISEIMNSLDLHVLSSAYGEAFPNVLAEAMACATPCVTTDVGDAAMIVDDLGWIVPVGAPEQLALAIGNAYGKFRDSGEYEELRLNCHRSIAARFSIDDMANHYKRIWEFYMRESW